MPRRPAPRRELHQVGWIWGVYAALFLASVPWYLPRGETPALFLGLPYWVVISLAATTAIALFTVWVLHRYWDEDTPGGEEDSEEGEA